MTLRAWPLDPGTASALPDLRLPSVLPTVPDARRLDPGTACR
jgi:hypothetical protein